LGFPFSLHSQAEKNDKKGKSLQNKTKEEGRRERGVKLRQRDISRLKPDEEREVVRDLGKEPLTN